MSTKNSCLMRLMSCEEKPPKRYVSKGESGFLRAIYTSVADINSTQLAEKCLYMLDKVSKKVPSVEKYSIFCTSIANFQPEAAISCNLITNSFCK